MHRFLAHRLRFDVARHGLSDDATLGAARHRLEDLGPWGRSGDELADVAGASPRLLVEPMTEMRVPENLSTAFHLIETMRHDVRYGIRDFGAHLARARGSAAFFGFRLDADLVRASVQRRVNGIGDSTVRIRCYRGGQFAVEIEPLPAPNDVELRVVIDPVAIDSGQPWPYHKTSLRRPYSDRLARHPDADEVLLLNDRSEITEACTANVAVKIGGTWWTPPVTSGCLPGVERVRLLAAGLVHEGTVHVSDLASAESVALVNSLRGWRPATLAGATRTRTASQETA